MGRRVACLIGSCVAIAAVLAAPAPGRAATVSESFPGFADSSRLTLNGSATTPSGVLQLTWDDFHFKGSAFVTQALGLTAQSDVSTRFNFRLAGSGDGADGMTFAIQGAGPTALPAGSGGNGLGFLGIQPSLGVEIDTYQGSADPSGNHVAVVRGGDVDAHLASYTPGFDLENGATHTMWVDYSASLKRLSVYVAQGVVATRPATPVLTYAVDLPQVVGPSVNLGFTAATGGLSNAHQVTTWDFTATNVNTGTPPSSAATSASTAASTSTAAASATSTAAPRDAGDGERELSGVCGLVEVDAEWERDDAVGRVAVDVGRLPFQGQRVRHAGVGVDGAERCLDAVQLPVGGVGRWGGRDDVRDPGGWADGAAGWRRAGTGWGSWGSSRAWAWRSTPIRGRPIPAAITWRWSAAATLTLIWRATRRGSISRTARRTRCGSTTARRSSGCRSMWRRGWWRPGRRRRC